MENSNKNILYLGRSLDVVDGGGVVSKRNIYYLDEISKGKLIEFTFQNRNILKKFANILMGKPWGYTASSIKEIKSLLASSNFAYIFIDHSLLGGYAQLLHKLNIPIITFFHNVEYIYYQEKEKVDGVVNRLMVWSAKNNEMKALKYSSKIICLTERDSHKLKSIYGRGADLILPTTLPDKYADSYNVEIAEHNYHLFVGSAFFANLDGISWYIENVLSRIDLTLIVIGNGMEVLNKKFASHPKLIVKGFVDQLEPYYKNALFVVNPIHKGSGMKTKTIEALMFGKTIIGTPEAFTGINNVEDEKIGYLCETADQFIKKINQFQGGKLNMSARNYFLKNFDLKKDLSRLKSFLEKSL